MKLRLSILHKGTIFIAAGFSVQLWLFCQYTNLVESAQEHASKQFSSKKMVGITNWVSYLMSSSCLFKVLDAFERDGQDSKLYGVCHKLLQESVAELSASADASEAQKMAAIELAAVVNKNLAFLDSLTEEGSRKGITSQNKLVEATNKGEFDQVWLSTSEARHKVLNEEVHRFALRHEDLTSSKKESLRQYANMELALGIVLCFASIFFFGGMVRRILNVAYNAERFARQVPLLPTIAGSDEIASLDESFHLMATQLEESMRKERAVIANAVDVICSLNSQLEIAAINPAVVKLLGYSQEELLNHSFKELVFDDDLALVVRHFCDLKAIESELEIRVRRKDGEVRDFLWSTRWVESEKLVFCIGHDVTEKRNAERMKQDVMNMVSHDLRTPLTTIMNSLAMFSDGMFGEMEPKAARVLQRAESCVDRMMHLTKDLLDIEKIRSGTLILEKAEFPVARAFQKAATSVSAMAAMKNITVDISEDHGNVFADEERVVQVLVNLLSNAVKFSQNGGRIDVFASLNEKRAKISVRDYGRGIPAEKVNAIFSKFEQVRASDASKEGGTGLGLAICKSLVELHEGKILVESVAGEGSTFSFELPAFGEV